MTRVALIGFGEVGRVFADDLGGTAYELSAWDVAFNDARSKASRNAVETTVRVAPSSCDAVKGADLVISAVTAAHCAAAAETAAASIGSSTWYFDLNSSSPGQKQRAAKAIEEAGGRYVEAALMSPIGPKRLRSPFLLGGPHAADFAVEAAAWGLSDARVFSADVGPAAAAKLCRSVIVKGFESLLTESLLAARTHGVERDVLDSLSNILPTADWEAVAEYFIGRSLEHGQRRSEEMLEAAATVREAGVEPIMSIASALRQSWAGGRGVGTGTTLTELLDQLATSPEPLSDATGSQP
jgi:3-hydroxyisobutyrate dehydrogenase-like beta-hydroxyacid dehydrogenase